MERPLWVRPCTWGLLIHSQMCACHPTDQGVGTKENHRLPPRSQSHNGHNKGLLLSTPCWPRIQNLSGGKSTVRVSHHTSFYVIEGRVGEGGVEFFHETGRHFSPVAVEVVIVALAEALREFWYLASQVLLLWCHRLSVFSTDSWPWVGQKPTVSRGRSKAGRRPIGRESDLSHPCGV